MTCKLRGRLREPEKLRGKVTGTRVSGPDGLYLGGIYQGVANGYYVSNVKTNIPDGCYRDGGLVDPYYEKIRDAALAQGGGLYLFQLEHGHYAGEQVIWQEMGELTPWVPGLLTPQGKTYDLMGSGEYLGQSVSMRRPVDGVWDGVGTWMDASSDAVGGHLHQDRPSAWFAGLEILSTVPNANILSTGTVGINGIYVRTNNNGLIQYIRNTSGTTTTSAYNIGLEPGHGIQVTGASRGSRRKFYLDGASVADVDGLPPYPDTQAGFPLRVGARSTGGLFIHARYTYIAIYTREPTPYEISLHKRTP